MDAAIWRYTSVLTAQPFDVAKTILQAYVVPDSQDGQRPADERRRSGRMDSFDESDEV
jgi:fusion and transport protein UGO1